jgi:nucleoside phosphorylase
MFDVAVFTALGWERRVVTGVLGGVEPAGRPRTWRGRLGDGGSCLIVQTGVGPDHAAAVAAAVPPARRFLSCGCAGGLSGRVRAGDVVVADAVARLDAAGRPAERLPADVSWLAGQAAACGLAIHVGTLVASPVALSGVAVKAAAGAGGALAVDMESGALAAAARARGVPFAALRVVLDPGDQELPFGPDLMDGVSGELVVARALALGLRPWLWPAAVRLARQTRAAERSLGAAVEAVLGGGHAVPAVALG